MDDAYKSCGGFHGNGFGAVAVGGAALGAVGYADGGNGGVGDLANKLYNTLYGIQTGKVEDDMGWTVSL